MRYAESQIILPQREHGCDYGAGKRRLLVRNRDQRLVYTGGHTYKRRFSSTYLPAELTLQGGRSYASTSLSGCEGKFRPEWLQTHQDAIFKHLGQTFDLRLVVPWATLLLDEKGTVTEPAPKVRMNPARPAPLKLGAPKLYRVVEINDEIRLVSYTVTQEKRGHVWYVPDHRPEATAIEMMARDLLANGYRTEPERAVAAWLEPYEDAHANAVLEAENAQGRVVSRRAQLDEARQSVEGIQPYRREPDDVA